MHHHLCSFLEGVVVNESLITTSPVVAKLLSHVNKKSIFSKNIFFIHIHLLEPWKVWSMMLGRPVF